MATLSNRRRRGARAGCLVILTGAVLAPGCSKGQEPSSATPGKQAAPVQQDRTKSK
jgi:hypothetical protein